MEEQTWTISVHVSLQISPQLKTCLSVTQDKYLQTLLRFERLFCEILYKKTKREDVPSNQIDNIICRRQKTPVSDVKFYSQVKSKDSQKPFTLAGKIMMEFCPAIFRTSSCEFKL